MLSGIPARSILMNMAMYLNEGINILKQHPRGGLKAIHVFTD
jgi:hypothetical protein